MQIDWSTFLLEVVNFLVLVWILRRFLYQPVLDVIARRRAAIEAALGEARDGQARAEALRAQYEGALRLGEKRYRGAQLFGWLYRKNAREVEGMTDIGKAFRSSLRETAVIAGIRPLDRQTSGADGTTKFLFGLADDRRIEAVLIPPASAFRRSQPKEDDEQKRLMLCVSTQVGCPLDCAFCATATMGFLRNLSAGEFVDQLHQVRRITSRPVTNVVFMGMGEPLLNYDAVMDAAEIFTAGMGIVARRITVSSAGWVDGIRRMPDEARPVKLAVSLHSAYRCNPLPSHAGQPSPHQ